MHYLTLYSKNSLETELTQYFTMDGKNLCKITYVDAYVYGIE